jgi:MFS family permease
VAALFVAQFGASFVPFGIGALAPFLREEYGLARAQVGLATSAIFVAVVACSLPAGRFSDRAGVPIALAVSCTIVAIGTAAVALAPVLGIGVVGLLIVGAGYSIISPATNRGVIVAVPPRVRGRAMGVKQMAVTAGGALAAATLPFSVSRVGLETTLLITASAIAAMGAVASLVFGWRVGRARVARDGADVGPPSRSIRRRIIWLGVAIGGMVAAQHVVATYLTLFLVDGVEMTVAAAAGSLTVLHLSGTVGRLAWGWVSDRAGSRLATMMVIGSVSTVALLVLGGVGARLPLAALVVLVVVLGVATQGGNAVYQIAVAEEAPERAGWASGVGMTIGFSGGIVAPPAFGATVDATGSYALAFALTAGVVLGATAIVRALATGAPDDVSLGRGDDRTLLG